VLEQQVRHVPVERRLRRQPRRTGASGQGDERHAALACRDCLGGMGDMQQGDMLIALAA
jgi:hypothetical protein